MRISVFIKKNSIRLTILLFWLVIFSGSLYLPLVFNRYATNRSINVATWSDMIAEEVLQQFKAETGITVNLSYFDDNDELLVKMRATKGHGYDLIIPSDYTVEQLIQEDLLQPLDKKKFTQWDRIVPRLLDCYFDPDNRYSIPYYWGIYGLGVDTEFFKGTVPEASWDLIFERLPGTSTKIAMLNTPRESILLTAYYLFKSIDALTPEKCAHIKSLLLDQKQWVEAYAEFRADYLLISKACPVVVMTTPFVFRLMSVTPHVEFIVPREGSFMITDNWVIPKASSKSDLVYELLNFLYRPTIIAHHFDVFTFFPATVDLAQLIQERGLGASVYNAHFDTSLALDFFRNVISKDAINDIWITLKAS